MKIIVGHPFKQHSFELATALEKKEMLYAYCTTVYDKPGTVVFSAKKMLKGSNLKKANSRKCSKIPDEKIHIFAELRGLGVLATNRLSSFPNAVRVFQRSLYKVFGKKIANYAIKENVDIIVMYDSTATKCFEVLSKKLPSCTRVLDMSTCTRAYAKKIYEYDMELTGRDDFKTVQGYLWKKGTIEYLNRELELTDYFVVASEFVRKSLLYCGIKNEQIIKVPYGVDTSTFKYVEKSKESIKNAPLKMVFVGQVDYRKGIMHLFSAMKKFDVGDISLKLVGGYDSTSDLYKCGSEMENVEFLGFVTKDRLSEIYNEADVFVFPTLCEGFGLVVLEAMACGVPVICSENAGGNDTIIEGDNGFHIPACSVEAIEDKLNWCLNNRESLYNMRAKAYETSQIYTWDKYYEGIGGAFEFITRRKKDASI
jgi:glycosyltransferase involved in cell wall biosynthesis